MNHLLKMVFLLTLTLIFGSCAINRAHIDYKKVLPRQSFIKFEKDIKIRSCKDEICVERDFGTVASGVVVQNKTDGAYVLTAAHVCDISDMTSELSSMPGTTFEIDFSAVTIDLRKKPAKVVKFNHKHDICLVWVENLLMPAAPISPKAPEPGDVVLNIAAPLGVHSENMIPIFKGFFNGTDVDGVDFYSLPSFGGSSGSPILNTKGEIIGMIHSTIVHFHNISISPNYYVMVEFINETIDNDIRNRYWRALLRPFLEI